MNHKLRITLGIAIVAIAVAILWLGSYGLIDTHNHGWLWVIGQGLLLGRIGYVVIVNGDVWKNVRYAATIALISALLVSKEW